MYWQEQQRAWDLNTDRHWFLCMSTQLATLSTCNQNHPPQSLASAALKCYLQLFPIMMTHGSDTSGINSSYFLIWCWVAYMLPVEISMFLPLTSITSGLCETEFGEPCHCSHVVNKVEKTGTGIHRKGWAQFDVYPSAFCKLWTTVHVLHAGLSHHRLSVGNRYEYGEFFSCTSIIWDLSFSHWGWITEDITTDLNLCLEYLLHFTINLWNGTIKSYQELKEEPGIFEDRFSHHTRADDHLQCQLLVEMLNNKHRVLGNNSSTNSSPRLNIPPLPCGKLPHTGESAAG